MLDPGLLFIAKEQDNKHGKNVTLFPPCCSPICALFT